MTRAQAEFLMAVGRDIGRAVLIALGIVVVSFFMIRMIPGDVVDVLGIEGSLTYGQQEDMREELGLNRNWLLQFRDWLGMILSGDLGTSLRFNTPISDLLVSALPTTVTLGASGLLIGLVAGFGLPILACLWLGTIFRSLVEFITIWSIAVPTFSVGFVCLLVFAVWLDWIPALGNLLVPSLILGANTAGTLAKMLYEDMVETETADFVRTARSKGLSRARIVLRHILPNAATVAVALSGLLMAGALTGAVTMEVVFGLPGLGTLALQAIQGHDYPVVQAVVIWLGIAIVLANLVSDMMQRVLDPRQRRT